MVLDVLSTAGTPQLHVGASPKPLQPPLLQDKLWFRITRELWDQEKDDWPLDISSTSQKKQKKSKPKIRSLSIKRGTLIWSQIKGDSKSFYLNHISSTYLLHNATSTKAKRR